MMKDSNLMQFSSTRLPADHLLSGALLGAVTTLAYDLSKDGIRPKDIALNVAKNSLCGGIATAVAVNSSNAIVQKRYLDAGISLAVGVAGIILVQKMIK